MSARQASTLVCRQYLSVVLSRKAPRRGQGDRRPSEDHPGVYGVQGAELHHPEEPPERPGPDRAAEVLPARWPPHPAPRDPLIFLGSSPPHDCCADRLTAGRRAVVGRTVV